MDLRKLRNGRVTCIGNQTINIFAGGSLYEVHVSGMVESDTITGKRRINVMDHS